MYQIADSSAHTFPTGANRSPSLFNCTGVNSPGCFLSVDGSVQSWTLARMVNRKEIISPNTSEDDSSSDPEESSSKITNEPEDGLGTGPSGTYEEDSDSSTSTDDSVSTNDPNDGKGDKGTGGRPTAVRIHRDNIVSQRPQLIMSIVAKDNIMEQHYESDSDTYHLFIGTSIRLLDNEELGKISKPIIVLLGRE
ncbi:unnamed protein product [Timema podura]|uniref:Uncharacterized protein n=1 Tax=Timema podura TaxID=61482 RepID=A0ABN7NJ13_TIMPD|nr:unnamed protein product [Timema podura]